MLFGTGDENVYGGHDRRRRESLYHELEELLAQKERIERQIARKSEELQHLN